MDHRICEQCAALDLPVILRFEITQRLDVVPIDNNRASAASDILAIFVQERDLSLQLVRGGPVVVVVENRDVFASSPGYAVVGGFGDVSRHAAVKVSNPAVAILPLFDRPAG